MASNLEKALEYAQRGWLVFPCHYPIAKGKCSCGRADCDSPAKHPMTRAGCKDASKDFKQIKAWWTKSPNANVGIATGPDTGMVVIDIDPRHGGLESMKALKKLGSLPVFTPTVATGGGGQHIYLAYPNNGTKVRNQTNLAGYNGIDIRGDGGYVIAPPSRHIGGGKYTWSVKHIGNSPAPIPQWLKEIFHKSGKHSPQESAFKMPLEEKDIIYSSSNEKYTLSLEGCNKSVTGIPDGTRDVTIFELVKTLRMGGMDYDKVAQYAVMFGERCCDPPMPERIALEKVKSTWNAERDIGTEIKSYLSVTKGVFSLQDVKYALHIVTQKENTLLRVTLHRLCKANILERLEKFSGMYRKVETDLEMIDLTHPETEEALNIKWPFGLENLVDILPKNIVIVAGSKDAGKSAFCLNVVKMNMHRWDCRYFSSEMGRHELIRRLRRFDDLKVEDWKFSPYLRASRFADVIFPNALNVVDFLEITREPYLIAEEIRAIYDKLDKGVCIIAVQKDKDAEFGRGKSFSLEKSRMYLTLDRQQMHNILTIKSGKNWHQEGVNPAGITVKYKVINGAKLLEYE